MALRRLAGGALGRALAGAGCPPGSSLGGASAVGGARHSANLSIHKDTSDNTQGQGKFEFNAKAKEKVRRLPTRRRWLPAARVSP